MIYIPNTQKKKLTPVNILRHNIYNFTGPRKSPDNGFSEYAYIWRLQENCGAPRHLGFHSRGCGRILCNGCLSWKIDVFNTCVSGKNQNENFSLHVYVISYRSVISIMLYLEEKRQICHFDLNFQDLQKILCIFCLKFRHEYKLFSEQQFLVCMKS